MKAVHFFMIAYESPEREQWNP